MLLESLLAVGLHIGTHHRNIDEGYKPNNFNPGVYVETVDNYMLGAYHNSDNRLTIYAGKALYWGNASLMVGVATGYNKPIVPAIIPAYKVNIAKDVAGKIWYVPKVASGAEAIHFSVELALK